MSLSIVNIAILSAATLMFLSAVTPFFNPFYRFRRMLKRAAKDSVSENPETSAEAIPLLPITVLIVADRNQSQALESHLPCWLEQRYEPGFEVVVVAEKGDGETEDVVRRFSRYPNLYATYVPQSSRYMSRQKLAITLGVKAAKNEWIVMTDVSGRPSSEEWLSTVAPHCGESRNLVLVYGNYDSQARAFHRFATLQSACYLLKRAMNKTAYRSNTTTCAFRKSEFIRRDGYRGNLEFVRGEYDFLVNKFAQKRKTAVVLDPKARMINDAPKGNEWHNRHIFYMHTRKFLKRSRMPRFVFNTDQFLLHLTVLLQLFMIVAGSVLLSQGENHPEKATTGAILLASGILSLMVTVALRTVFAKSVIRFFDADIALWRVFPYELSIFWRNRSYSWSYSRSEKSDFSTHKL